MRLPILTIFLALLLLQSCKKNSARLAEAPREYLIFMLSGKWELKAQRPGLGGSIYPFPPNHEVEFKFSNGDSTIYSINGAVVERSLITWSRIEDLNDRNNVLTIMSSSVIPYMSVASLGAGRLTLYQPLTDGSTYFLKRKD